MKEYYRYTKRDLDREFKRGASRGRELQKHIDISEFLEDLEYARNELLNHYNYEPNIILIELRKKWEGKLK